MANLHNESSTINYKEENGYFSDEKLYYFTVDINYHWKNIISAKEYYGDEDCGDIGELDKEEYKFYDISYYDNENNESVDNVELTEDLKEELINYIRNDSRIQALIEDNRKIVNY